MLDVVEAGNIEHYGVDLIEFNGKHFWQKKTRIPLPEILKGRIVHVT